MKKHYILRRTTSSLTAGYLHEFSGKVREKIEKQIESTKPLLLIEKTTNKDNIEEYTNMWSVEEGGEILWKKFTKGRLMYDYTGVVSPLIHLKNRVLTFEQYTNEIADTQLDTIIDNLNEYAQDYAPCYYGLPMFEPHFSAMRELIRKVLNNTL